MKVSYDGVFLSFQPGALYKTNAFYVFCCSKLLKIIVANVLLIKDVVGRMSTFTAWCVVKYDVSTFTARCVVKYDVSTFTARCVTRCVVKYDVSTFTARCVVKYQLLPEVAK
jgi:hypothetical protein